VPLSCTWQFFTPTLHFSLAATFFLPCPFFLTAARRGLPPFHGRPAAELPWSRRSQQQLLPPCVQPPQLGAPPWRPWRPCFTLAQGAVASIAEHSSMAAAEVDGWPPLPCSCRGRATTSQPAPPSSFPLLLPLTDALRSVSPHGRELPSATMALGASFPDRRASTSLRPISPGLNVPPPRSTSPW
jgi:hypothetical protein